MKKTLLVMLALTLAVPLASAQSEALNSGVGVDVRIGRVDGQWRSGVAAAEGLSHVNVVRIDFRHCQKYMHKTGGFLGFGGKTVVDQAACNADPRTLYATRQGTNLVTDAGFDVISAQISGSASATAVCKYIAVTNTAITPAAGDTTLSGEISSNGLSRAAGTYAHTTGVHSFTVAKTFTATGTQASQATGLFDASSTGNLCAELTYTSVTVNNGDTLTVTWTWNLS